MFSPALKLLLLRQSAALPLDDSFTNAASAPLAGTRTCVPGPGVLTITDTNNNLSITGGELAYAGSAAAANNPRLVSDTYTRVAGLAAFARIKGASGTSAFGWSDSTDLSGTQNTLWMPGASAFEAAGSIALVDTNDGSSYYRLASVLRTQGAFLFVNGLLAWVHLTGSSQIVYGGMASRAAGAGRFPPIVDYLRIRQLTGAFGSDNGIATVNANVPPSTSTYTATADGIHDFAFVLPSSPSAGQKIELRYRILDSDNYWVAYAERNGGNTAWDFKLDSVIAGVATNRISVTTIAANTGRIRVLTFGTSHACYTLAGTSWVKRGSTISVTTATLDSQTTISPVYAAGNGVLVASFPRTSTFYSTLE